MNFHQVIGEVTSRLDAAGIRYGLIGGFAMALRGVQRATVDLDFILMLEDMEKADSILQSSGYTRAFSNKNVSHYMGKEQELGRIDIIHAFRGPTLGMLERVDRIEVVAGLTLPVVQIEDIIGLKIQATVNAPGRASSDWADIQMMLEVAGECGNSIDWDLLQEYLGLFQLEDKLETLKQWYGTANRGR